MDQCGASGGAVCAMPVLGYEMMTDMCALGYGIAPEYPAPGPAPMLWEKAERSFQDYQQQRTTDEPTRTVLDVQKTEGVLRSALLKTVLCYCQHSSLVRYVVAAY